MLNLFAMLCAAGALALVWAVAAHSQANGPGVARDIAVQAVAGLLFVLAAVSARSYRSGEAKIEDGGFPSLRFLGWLTPAAVFGQVALGALYRNGLTGLTPHVTWAFGAAILAMMLGTFVLTQPVSRRAMDWPAVALIVVTGLQVVLGVVALILRIQAEQAGELPEWMRWIRATHAATGSAVLGLSGVLGVLIFRNVGPPARQELAENGRRRG